MQFNKTEFTEVGNMEGRIYLEKEVKACLDVSKKWRGGGEFATR